MASQTSGSLHFASDSEPDIQEGRAASLSCVGYSVIFTRYTSELGSALADFAREQLVGAWSEMLLGYQSGSRMKSEY